jgi:hypothetical protein
MNPPPVSDAVHSAGPFRVAERDVVVRTSCVDFAALVSEVFVDLRRGPGDAPSTSTIEFLVVAVAEPEPHWAIWRDGEACELELREDAVLVQLQWELNRLVIERYRAVVHSGAVAIDGRVVLLAGRSHSGKTTLTGTLCAHYGGEYLTDEAASLDEEGRVRPYPRPLGLRPTSPLWSAAAWASAGAVRFLPEEQLVPVSRLGGPVGRAPRWPGLVVFPHFRSGSSLSITPLTQADTIERLAHLTPGLVRHGAEVFRRLMRLVTSTVSIHVAYGDSEAAAQCVVDAVHRARGAS